MPDGVVLSEQDRAKLDGIVQKMMSNKESEDNIRFVVDDFKNKYGLKKKESSELISQERAGGSPTRTTQQGTSSDTEPPTRAQASGGLGGQTSSPFQSIDAFGGKGPVGAIVSEQQKTQQPPAKKAAPSVEKENTISVKGTALDKNKEEDGFVDYLIKSVDSGIATVSKSIYDAPALIYDAAASLTNPIARAFGGEEASSEKFAETFGLRNIPSEMLKEKIDRTNKSIQEYNDKNGGDALTAIQNGNYTGAAKMVAGTTMQSLPLMVAAMATGGESLAMTGIGVSAASTKASQLKEENPEMDVATRTTNAAVSGILEATLGHLLNGASGAVVKKIITDKGVEAGSKIVSNSIKNILEKNIEKNPVIGLFGEVVEESLVEFGDQANDMLAGKRDSFNYKDIANAGISATGMGATNTVAVYGAKGFVSSKDYIKAKNINKEISKLTNELTNENLSDTDKGLISNKINRLVVENQKIIGDGLEKVNVLPEDIKKNLLEVNSKLDDVKSQAFDIKDNNNISDETKKTLLDELKLQFKTLEDERVNILSGKTTAKDMSVNAPEKNVFYYYEAKGEKAPTEIPSGYTSIKKVENSEEVKLWNTQKPSEVTPTEVKAEEITTAEIKPTEVKGISPETSSNVANLTKDNEGNYVFYHTSPTTLETIEPNKYGTNPKNVTSAEEKTAIGRVNGVSMYYPAENIAENIVSGNTHIVKIPESEVYDFNADPLNLIEEARTKFEKEFPGMAFTPNDQFAQVTKLANEKGFKMIVGEWKDTTRAQTTEPLKPVDVKEMRGDVVVKPFKEEFVSNKDKGFKSIIPETKEGKLIKLYDEIYSFKNSINKYDNLYHLKEDYAKLSQEEITKMIEDSDLPQEYKDSYNEALKYEPEQRRTEAPTSKIIPGVKTVISGVEIIYPTKEQSDIRKQERTAVEYVDKAANLLQEEDVDTIKKELDGNFGLLTAENPMAQPLTENENSELNKKAEEWLKEKGYNPRRVTGKYDQAENSFFVPGLTKSDSVEFAKEFNQESVAHSEGLVYQDGSINQRIKRKDNFSFEDYSPESNYVSIIKTKDGLKTFSVGYDFETKIPAEKPIEKENINSIVETEKRKGVEDKDIIENLLGQGYNRKEATNAILEYNKVTSVKLRKEDSVFTKEGRNKIVTFLDQIKRRALSARSFLPKSVFIMRDKIESNIKAEAKRASYLVNDFNKLVKSYKGDINALNDEFDKYLRGDQTAVLPDEFKAVAGKMRMHIDNLSQMLLRTGAVSVSQAETIAKNLGQYVNRSYQVFDKKDWSKQVTDEMKEAAKVDLRSMYRAEAESKAKQTGMDADIILEDFIDKKIEDLIGGESAATFLGISKTGAKNLSIMKERLDIPLSIRQLMGEYTDASQNYARTVLKIATLAENSRFLQSARESGMGVFFYNENDTNRPKEFNTKIAGEKSDTMSPLNGLYTTTEIAKAFAQKIGTGDAIEAALGTELGPVVRGIYETYMKALSSVKWLKTIGSVATHAKNVTGNVWFMLSNGYYNPKKYAEAFSVLKNSSKEDLRNKLDEYIRAGIIDQSAALGEIKAMFADADFDTAIESRLKKNPFENVKAGVKKLGQKMSTAYQLEDDFFKIISYESEKERYSNADFNKPFDELTTEEQNTIREKASEITKNILPNYARIPGLVKLLKAVPVAGTFVSFQAEAYRTAWNTVALAADELKSDNNKVKAIGAKRLAGIAASQAAKLGLMALMGTIISGGDDEDDDELKKNTKLFVAPWSKDSDLVLVDYGNGKMSYIDFSASDPHGGIKKAYNSVMAGKDITESFTNGITQLLEPFMKEDMLLNVITDIKDNKNAYGGKLYNESDTDTNKINAIMDRVYKAFEPGTITTVRKVVGSDDVRNELAGQLTGYKISTVDVNKQLGFKMNELKDLSGEAKKLYSSAFYKFEDEKITGDELDKTYDQANKSQKDVYNKMMDYMKAASFLGVDDYLIEDNMQGVGKAVINDLWYGEAPDMKMKEVEE